MTEEDIEIDQKLRVKPDVLSAMLQFKTLKTMQKLQKKQDAYYTFRGPMTRKFEGKYIYQHATIEAGQNGRVWWMPNPEPERLVGLITTIANSYVANTYMEWFIDHKPTTVELTIGVIGTPTILERGIPFFEEVEWRGFNNNDDAQVFEVYLEGFFIPLKLYRRIVEYEK